MHSDTRSRRARASSRPAVAPLQHAGRPGLSVDVRSDAGRPVVTVAGALDLSGAGLVTAMLDHVRRRQADAPRAVGRRDQVDVDLAGVTSVDRHGLASVADGRARIVAASEPVRRLRRAVEDLAEARADPDRYAASA